MVVDDARPNIGFYMIMKILEELRRKGVITREEYERAEKFYREKTHATIVYLYRENPDQKH